MITVRNHVIMPVWSASKPGVERCPQTVWPVSRTKLCKVTPHNNRTLCSNNGLNTAVKTLQPSQKGSIVSCGWTRDYHSLLFLCWNDVEVRNIRWNMRQATPSSRLEYKMAAELRYWNLIIFSASLLHLGSTQDINNCTYRHRKM